jgi:hypothetical protein
VSAISHSPNAHPERRGWSAQILVPEMWAALSIGAMWLAVLFDAIFGPDFVSTTSGGNTTTIPSAIVVAVFAYLGTRVVAKHGFGDRRDQ